MQNGIDSYNNLITQSDTLDLLAEVRRQHGQLLQKYEAGETVSVSEMVRLVFLMKNAEEQIERQPLNRAVKKVNEMINEQI